MRARNTSAEERAPGPTGALLGGDGTAAVAQAAAAFLFEAEEAASLQRALEWCCLFPVLSISEAAGLLRVSLARAQELVGRLYSAGLLCRAPLEVADLEPRARKWPRKLDSAQEVVYLPTEAALLGLATLSGVSVEEVRASYGLSRVTLLTAIVQYGLNRAIRTFFRYLLDSVTSAQAGRRIILESWHGGGQLIGRVTVQNDTAFQGRKSRRRWTDRLVIKRGRTRLKYDAGGLLRGMSRGGHNEALAGEWPFILLYDAEIIPPLPYNVIYETVLALSLLRTSINRPLGDGLLPIPLIVTSSLRREQAWLDGATVIAHRIGKLPLPFHVTTASLLEDGYRRVDRTGISLCDLALWRVPTRAGRWRLLETDPVAAGLRAHSHLWQSPPRAVAPSDQATPLIPDELAPFVEYSGTAPGKRMTEQPLRRDVLKRRLANLAGCLWRERWLTMALATVECNGVSKAVLAHLARYPFLTVRQLEALLRLSCLQTVLQDLSDLSLITEGKPAPELPLGKGMESPAGAGTDMMPGYVLTDVGYLLTIGWQNSFAPRADYVSKKKLCVVRTQRNRAPRQRRAIDPDKLTQGGALVQRVTLRLVLPELLLHQEHARAINWFFARLLQESAGQSGMRAHWTEEGEGKAMEYLTHWEPAEEAKEYYVLDGETYALDPDAYGEYVLPGRRLPFFLEWDTGEGNKRDYQMKLENYIRYAAVHSLGNGSPVLRTKAPAVGVLAGSGTEPVPVLSTRGLGHQRLVQGEEEAGAALRFPRKLLPTLLLVTRSSQAETLLHHLALELLHKLFAQYIPALGTRLSYRHFPFLTTRLDRLQTQRIGDSIWRSSWTEERCRWTLPL